ncbi:hypothetical protein [Parapedobacter tibetensis]|uniref:hypothetical protein n=1 Tax=Parapedobacter tibetensis TaxID=2972951 RepID=UPI00214DA403|nr:hypothetical protein [Parapedobacter tibetensis]
MIKEKATNSAEPVNGMIYTMMRFTYLILGSMTAMTLSSCSQENILDTESKSAYVASLQKLSGSEREKQAQADAKQLELLVDSVKTMTYYFGFSLDLSSGSGGTPTVDTASAFQLQDRDTLKHDFLAPDRQLSLVQQYALPESGFAFGSGNEERGFQWVNEEDIQYHIKEIFHGGKAVAPTDLALRRADSVLVEATYKFPVRFDTLVIDINQREPVVYKGDTVDLEEVTAHSVEFALPIDLANAMIDNHGVMADGTLVDNNSYSGFPVIGVHPDRLAAVSQLQSLLASADGETVMEQLDNVSDSTFVWLNKLVAFQETFNDQGNADVEDVDAQIDVMKGWTDTYADLLGAVSKTYRIAFPQPVEQVYLYVASEYEEVSRSFVARNNQPSAGYHVFVDRPKQHYGIADSLGGIIIPVEYTSLREESGGFFVEQKDGVLTTYSLNTGEKKLDPFPEGIRFWAPLNETLAVFKNEDGYAGLLDKEKREIIPFAYDGFDVEGNIVIANASLRGRTYFHFYTLAGKRIEVPEKITTFEAGDGGVTIGTRDDRSGRIDGQGNVTFNTEGR